MMELSSLVRSRKGMGDGDDVCDRVVVSLFF